MNTLATDFLIVIGTPDTLRTDLSLGQMRARIAFARCDSINQERVSSFKEVGRVP
jgi:hypothetical protein